MIQSGKSFKRILIRELMPCDEANSIFLESLSGETLDCDYHYHPEMELTLIVSGSGRVLFGTEWSAFQPGDLALIGGGVPHLYVTGQSGRGAKAAEHSETRVVKLDRKLVECGLFLLPEFAPVRRLFAEAGTAVRFQHRPEFRDGIESLFALPPPERILHLSSLLLRLAELPRHAVAAPENAARLLPSGAEREKIERVIRLLQRRFTEKLTLGDVAKSIGMGQESFRRFFRRCIKIGFSDYLVELRLSCAARMLHEGTESISEVAAASGFRSLANFNRLFRDRRRMTPREYRRQARPACTDEKNGGREK